MLKLVTPSYNLVSQVLPGTAAVQYAFQFRVRVQAALKPYVAGTVVTTPIVPQLPSYVKKNVTPTTGYDTVRLFIPSGPHTGYYYLNNSATVVEGNVFLDYMLNLTAIGGTTITLMVDSSDGYVYDNLIIGAPSTILPDDDVLDQFHGIFARLDFTYHEILTSVTTKKSGGVRGFRFSAWGENILIKATEK